jgi:esterase
MKLAFREYGEGEPLLILHGLFGQSDNWSSLARQFAANRFRTFTIDQRNHGLSPHSDDFTFPLLAEDLNGFIAEHGLEKPVLIGHSLGAKTVLYHEYANPGSASKLILADMAARAYTPQHDNVIEALNAVDFTTVTSRREVEAVLAKFLSDAGTRQFLLKNVYWVDEKAGRLGWRFNLASLTKNYPEVNRAVPHFESSTPTLVMRGERSDYVNANDLKDYAERFSNLEQVTIPGAGHWLHAEKPAEFLEAALRFIKA